MDVLLHSPVITLASVFCAHTHIYTHLTQVVRLTDEPFSAAKGVKSPLTEEKIVEWLVGKKVLSIALQGVYPLHVEFSISQYIAAFHPLTPSPLTPSPLLHPPPSPLPLLPLLSTPLYSTAVGNLHHSQYCDKLRSIVEFLGVRLSLEELSSIWEMQVDGNPVQVENVHSILAAAASRFTAQHLDHLFTLISQVQLLIHSVRHFHNEATV